MYKGNENNSSRPSHPATRATPTAIFRCLILARRSRELPSPSTGRKRPSTSIPPLPAGGCLTWRPPPSKSLGGRLPFPPSSRKACRRHRRYTKDGRWIAAVLINPRRREQPFYFRWFGFPWFSASFFLGNVSRPGLITIYRSRSTDGSSVEQSRSKPSLMKHCAGSVQVRVQLRKVVPHHAEYTSPTWQY